MTAENSVTPSNEQPDECLESHITDASWSSMKLTQGSATAAASEGERGGGEKIRGCCHNFYADHTSA